MVKKKCGHRKVYSRLKTTTIFKMVKKIKFEIFLFKLVRMMLFLIFELSCCCELLFIKKYFVIGKQENFLIPTF